MILPVMLAALSACSPAKKQEVTEEASPRTPETAQLLDLLAQTPGKGYLFGHHDDTLYGIGWEGDSARSDVKSVCGDYPAIISFDLGHIELGDSASLDNVTFERIRQESIRQYERGGVVSMSWHLNNPLTGGDAWDVSDTTVVASVLPGGAQHQKFVGWLDRLADFLDSVKTPEGVEVPILFRPWHEHTGSWFWWGQKLCSDEQYKALWQLTYNHLSERGTNQHLLYAYSPGGEGCVDSTAYLQRYPGDDIIDVMGFDCYQFGPSDKYLEDMHHSLATLQQVSQAHGKVMAVTETGFEGIPDAEWWTGTLTEAIGDAPISYVLVWRNAREKVGHFYAPYPGQASADDFVKFYQSTRTRFCGDLKK
jgi:mannan endo-1,4-beta-mannosidase